jgi:tRNA (guanine-N7-)-methyltransferase
MFLIRSPVDSPDVSDEYSAIVAGRRREIGEKVERILSLRPRSPFLFEIGSGHGHFLTAYASAHPEKLCIGIDVVSERVERALRKRDRAVLENLHFLRAEARLFLQALPVGARISEVFILFPDPWPKLRHHKHRILQPEFLVALASHATRDCRLYFRTDHNPYFDSACAVVRDSVHWELLDAPWPFEFETVFQSRAKHHESFIACLRGVAP